MQATTAATMRGAGRAGVGGRLRDQRHHVLGEPARSGGGGDRAVGESTGEAQHVRRQRADQHRRRRHVADVEPADHRQPVAAHVGRLAAEQRQQRLEVLAHELGRALVRHAQSAFDDMRVRHADAERQPAAERGLRRQRLGRQRLTGGATRPGTSAVPISIRGASRAATAMATNGSSPIAWCVQTIGNPSASARRMRSTTTSSEPIA